MMMSVPARKNPSGRPELDEEYKNSIIITLNKIDKNYTNSIIAIGAASPRRGSVLRIRVYPPLRSA